MGFLCILNVATGFKSIVLSLVECDLIVLASKILGLSYVRDCLLDNIKYLERTKITKVLIYILYRYWYIERSGLLGWRIDDILCIYISLNRAELLDLTRERMTEYVPNSTTSIYVLAIQPVRIIIHARTVIAPGTWLEHLNIILVRQITIDKYSTPGIRLETVNVMGRWFCPNFSYHNHSRNLIWFHYFSTCIT